MISVVMVNAGIDEWGMFTEPAIASLRAHATEEYQLITVDVACGRRKLGDVRFSKWVSYSEAVNAGAVLAEGERLLILNNDITAHGPWQHHLDTTSYCGPVLLQKEGVQYIEGWCISIRTDLWHLVGGFHTHYRNSWEDVDLAWRLSRMAYVPHKIHIPLHHIWGATRHRHPGSNKHDEENRQFLLRRMREAEAMRYLDIGHFGMESNG